MGFGCEITFILTPPDTPIHEKKENPTDCGIVGVRRRKDFIVEKLRGIEIRQANKTQLWKGTVGKAPERTGRDSSTPTTIS